MSRPTIRPHVSWAWCLALGTLLGCGSEARLGPPPPPPPANGVRLEQVATGLSNPLYLTSPPGDSRLFIVEQGGRIRVVKDGTLLATPFLDITSLVTSGGERGLLSMAFHPSYASNGFFYVDYTDRNGDTRVVRYQVSATNPDVAEPASAKLILFVRQPFSNHNGGLVMFGPDGKLYIGLGDGGSENDPQGNGQKRTTLLGKLLRIDVDAGDPYAIPAGNPFPGQPGVCTSVCPEIWALGLRNPWRFAFDPATSRLYIADVGQADWEEVNIEDAGAAGLNYGWSVMEGMHCFNPRSSCNQSGLTLPKFEFGHDQGCSIIGGFVYRGSRIPGLVGRYFYSDYCSGFLRSFNYDGSAIGEQTTWQVGDLGSVLSFGEDSARELYVLSANGTVYRIAPAG